jgi:hypothetical protein
MVSSKLKSTTSKATVAASEGTFFAERGEAFGIIGALSLPPLSSRAADANDDDPALERIAPPRHRLRLRFQPTWHCQRCT